MYPSNSSKNNPGITAVSTRMPEKKSWHKSPQMQQDVYLQHVRTEIPFSSTVRALGIPSG